VGSNPATPTPPKAGLKRHWFLALGDTLGIMTRRIEQRPGSEETLLALYDAVRAAEELDLTEQAYDEASWAEIGRLYDWPPDEGDATSDFVDGGEVDETERVTMSQAVGIVEHLLGGQPMRGGGRSGS
jgi:hypothetical protein